MLHYIILSMAALSQRVNQLHQQIRNLQKDKLLDRITQLENKVYQNKHPSNKRKSKHSHNSKKQKLCVFRHCPAGTIPKDRILDGQIKVADGSLCTFHTCPKGTIGIGWIGDGSDRTRLCTYAQCPKGSKELADYIKTKK
jgi:hypothetical protein